jgi:hypothetical protein
MGCNSSAGIRKIEPVERYAKYESHSKLSGESIIAADHQSDSPNKLMAISREILLSRTPEPITGSQGHEIKSGRSESIRLTSFVKPSKQITFLGVKNSSECRISTDRNRIFGSIILQDKDKPSWTKISDPKFSNKIHHSDGYIGEPNCQLKPMLLETNRNSSAIHSNKSLHRSKVSPQMRYDTKNPSSRPGVITISSSRLYKSSQQLKVQRRVRAGLTSVKIYQLDELASTDLRYSCQRKDGSFTRLSEFARGELPELTSWLNNNPAPNKSTDLARQNPRTGSSSALPPAQFANSKKIGSTKTGQAKPTHLVRSRSEVTENSRVPFIAKHSY